MTVIIVVRLVGPGAGYHASIRNNSSVWAIDGSADAAAQKLIREHPQEVGKEYTIKKL